MNTAIKKLSVIFLIVAMLVGAATVTASAREAISPEGDPLTYDVLPDGTLRVSAYESGQTDITIPSEVEGLAVTQIASKLFYNDYTLETLRFQDGCQIEMISNNFNNCFSLKSVDWGSSSSLKSISGSFKNCIALTELTIPASVQTIGEQSFSNCTALSTLTFAEGSQLTTIQKEAFAFTEKDNSMTPAAIETLTLPASLVTLEESAFHCIPVKHFALAPSSKLTEIPNGFLAADGDEGQPGVNTECKGVFDFVKRIFTPYESPFDYTPEAAAKACDCLESIDLGDKNSLSRIGIAAFKNQTHLTSINFGTESVSSELIIDGGAFAAVGNTALSDPEKPAAGIETLVFPSNLTEMDESAFLYARIKNIVFSDNCKLNNIGYGFLAIEGSDGAPMSNSSPDEPQALFIASNCLESIAFGKNNSLAKISSGAFKNQSHLTSIDFGTSNTPLEILYGAFAGAGNNAYLIDQNIDENLNAGIKNLVFPSNLKSMGEGAFRYARVENVTFSDNCQLKSIPCAFMTVEGTDAQPANQTSWISPSILNAANCLKTISFGQNNNLTEICSGSFKNQSHLTSIDFGTSDKDLTISYGAFVGAGNNAYLVEQKIDDTLNEGIETLVFPSGLKTLGECAFRFSRVKNVIFSDNNKLQSIPYAFLTVEGVDAGPGANNSYKPDNDKPIAVLNAANCLETISFGKNNHLSEIRSGSFKNQSHLTSIDFGTPAENTNLSISYGAFVGAGNNAYLVEQNIDTELNDGIDTLVLPSSLNSLGEGAFRYARIKNIILSDNAPISTLPYAFMTVDGSDAGPGANNYYKPDSDKSASVLNAANCLETISFGKDNHLSEIRSGSFKNQSHLTSIDFGTPVENTSLNISYGVFTGAGNNAYLVEQNIDTELNDGIDTLVLPSSLNSLGEGAFRYARIKNIKFSDNCKLQTIPYAFMTIDGSDGKPGDGDSTKLMAMLDAANCLVSVDFGKNNNVTTINSGAFKNQTHLSKIDFGNNADDSQRLSMQYGVFAGTAPATLTLPARVKLDGSGQFKKAKIQHLIFEDGCMLTELNDGFLTKDYLDKNDQPILETIDFGKNSSLEKISSGVFAGNENLKTLDLSETKVETIKNGAFKDCGLTEIILPDTLKQVTEGAFQGLDDLTLLVIDGDNELTTLEGGVFSSCDSLTTVNLLNSNITTIDDCLKDNKNLKRIIFPEKLKSITWTKPELSESYKEGKTDEEIKEIEAKTCPFYGCGNVNRLWFAAKNPDDYTFDDEVFQFLNESGIVYVPKGTSDSSIEAYKTKLTAAGLTFGAEEWKIKEYIPVTEVILDKDTAKVKVGKSITLTATVTPDDASVPHVTWSSSDPEIATVDKNGTVTGVSKGKAVITAMTKDGSVSAACTVTVKEPAPAITFTDVKPTDYFYDAVLWAVANGVTNGVTDELFDPEGSCTRAQAMTFLWRAYDCPEVSTDHSFTDVKKGSYYEDAICWAVANNITTGTSETTFSPNEKCTRGQIVTFLYRAAKAEPVTIANPFKDVAEDAYYYNPVLWAVKNDITKGTSATTFSPENQASTRAQIVTFIYRYMKGVEI